MTYYQKNRDKIITKVKEYYQKNRKKILKQIKNRTEKNKDRYLNYQTEYRKLHKKELSEYFKIRNKRDRIKLNIKHIIRKKFRYHNDINFRLRESISSRIRMALKRNFKSKSTMNLIDCSIKFLKQHLKKQFKLGMTWDNHGLYGWHIDHIIPCASFDLSKSNEQKRCFNYKNLQPLWAEENLRKKDKII